MQRTVLHHRHVVNLEKHHMKHIGPQNHRPFGTECTAFWGVKLSRYIRFYKGGLYPGNHLLSRSHREHSASVPVPALWVAVAHDADFDTLPSAVGMAWLLLPDVEGPRNHHPISQ